MHFGLGQSGAHAKDCSFLIYPDAEGHQNGAIHHAAAMTYLFVPSIQHQVAILTEGSVPPRIDFLVEQFGRARDLR